MNLFEASATLTLNTAEYKKSLKEAVKQAEQLQNALKGLRESAEDSGQRTTTLSGALTRLVNGNRQARETTEQTTRSILDFGNGSKTVSGLFSFFGNAVKDSTSKVSIFGDILKANLVSEAITKGFDTIVSGFEKIGSAATNFVKNSVSVGESFDSAMSQVYATMGDKASQMVEYNGELIESSEALRKFAKEMGATTKYSATESAEALNYMALAGYDAETSMAMLPNVMNLASAGAFDLARASDMLTDTQTAFGISLERTNQMVDEMAAAASNSSTSVAQLGDAFLTVGGLAKELNGGFVTLSNGTTATVDGVQELEIALGAMANAGIKGSEAGTHMRNLLMKLSAPTEDATKLFDELGISVFDDAGNMKSLKDVFGEMNRAFKDMNNQQQKLQAISEIFNARDTASATALLAAVEQSWDSLGEAILNADGAAAKMAETQLNNLAGAKTIMKSALEGFQINISDALNPFITPFVKFAGESLQSLTTTIEKEGTNGLRGTISNIVKNAGNLLYKNIPNLLKNVVKVLTAIKNGIADGLPSFMDSVRAMIAKTASYMEKELPEFIKAGQRITSEIGNGLIRNRAYLIRAISKVAKQISEGISSNLPVIIPAVTSGILTIIDELTKPEQITGFIDAGIELAIGLATGIGESASIIVEKVPEIVENLKQGFEDNKDKIKGAAETLLSALANKMADVKSILKEKAPKVMNKIRDELKNAVPKMASVADNVISKLANAFEASDKWQEIKDTFAVITNGLPETISEDGKIIRITLAESFDRIGKSVNHLRDSFQQAVSGTNSFLKAIADMSTAIASISVDAISRLISGIIDFGAWLTDYDDSGANAFRTALIGISTAIGTFAGAMKLMETIPAVIAGVQIAIAELSGFATGLWATLAANPLTALIAVLAGLVSAFIYVKNNSEEWQIGWQMMKDTWNGFIDSIISGWEIYRDTFNKIKKKLSDFGNQWNEFWQGYGAYLADGVQNFKDKIQELKDGVSGFIGNVKNKFNDLIVNFWTARLEEWASGMDELISKFSGWGADLVLNFIDGIDSQINPLHDAGTALGEMLYDMFHHSTPEEGYLKDDDTWFPDMMKNFADGIRNNAHLVTGQAETLAENLADTFRNPLAIGTTLTEPNLLSLPDLSLKADTSMFDKIKELLENPLIVRVRLAEGLENISDMFAAESLAMPEMNPVRPYQNDYIHQIDGIRNSYSTTNNYYNTANNSYETSRDYAENSRSTQTTVQTMNINVPGFNIYSEDDMENLANALINKISEKLETKLIQDNRGFGGVGF